MSDEPSSPAAVETSHFDTRDLAPERRFDVWRDSIGVLFDVGQTNGADPMRFNARMDSLLLDGVMLSRSVAGAQSFHRGKDRIFSDGMDHYMIQTFDRGHVDMAVGTGWARGQAGTMIVGDMTEALESYNSDYSLVSAFLPRSRLDPLLENPGSLHGVLIDSTSGAGQLLSTYMQSLMQTAHTLSARAAAAAAQSLLLLTAAACNQTQMNAADPPDWTDDALIFRARDIINRLLRREDLGPDLIAAELGISRSRLYRLFKPYGGVMDRVREQRLRRALGELVSVEGQCYQIGEIAFRWGFSSPNQFSRAFKDRFGCSPREARSQGLVQRRKTNPDEASAYGDRKYEAWIETLL
jgi:AraC-like DNA-binding protein